VELRVGASIRHLKTKTLREVLNNKISVMPNRVQNSRQSAKGAAARQQSVKELAGPLGDALDTATVLREFIRNPVDDHQATLIIPDIHHKVHLVQAIRKAHPKTPAIFLGDYFDDFYDNADAMRATCKWLKDALENADDTFLLGNHCFAYLSYELGVRWGFCSGWTAANSRFFTTIFQEICSCGVAVGSYDIRTG
jgi:Calcineurin-like phosphoesterase